MFNFSLDQQTESSAFDTVNKWDFLVIGGGPAGLNAALYAKRKGLVVGLIADELGGQLHNTSIVDNYLGIKMVEGAGLSDLFVEHLKELDVPILKGVHVQEIKKQDQDFQVSLSNGKSYLSKTLLVATGGAPRKLEIPGEDQYANKGVTYCATCDGPFFKDKHVIIAGGGNSAVEGVLDLEPFAKKMTIVHRSKFRADEILLEKIKKLDNLDIFLGTKILSVEGEDQMTGVNVLNKMTNEESFIKADGLLIEIGTVPNSWLIKDLVKTNDHQEVIVDKNQMTSCPGLFAAGDITEQPFKQIIISVSEGAKSALAVNQYLQQNYKGE